MGARPMTRIIQENIKKPLAEMVLFGDLSAGGGVVQVSVENDELTLSVQQDEELEAPVH